MSEVPLYIAGSHCRGVVCVCGRVRVFRALGVQASGLNVAGSWFRV